MYDRDTALSMPELDFDFLSILQTSQSHGPHVLNSEDLSFLLLLLDREIQEDLEGQKRLDRIMEDLRSTVSVPIYRERAWAKAEELRNAISVKDSLPVA